MFYGVFSRIERALLSICPDVIAARYRSLSLLLRVGLDIYPAAEQRPELEYITNLSLPAANDSASGGESLRTKVYVASGKPVTSRTRTVLVVHGFADSGHNDARIVNFSRAMAGAAGSVVVLPNFPLLIGCRMSDEAVASIRGAIQAIAKDPVLCPSGVVSVAAFCVCAGFAVLASADAGPVVDALLCVGAYADLLSLAEFCIHEKGQGHCSYGINAALSNFWHTDDPAYREIFLAELRDDHLLRKEKPEAELPGLLKKYPEQGRNFQRLYTDPAYLEESMRTAFANHRDESMRLTLLPERLQTLQCSSVTLVHAAVDGIIPPLQSAVLHDRLRTHTTIPTRLCVTPILNHGDKQELGLHSIYDAIQLVEGFSMFFRNQGSLRRRVY